MFSATKFPILIFAIYNVSSSRIAHRTVEEELSKSAKREGSVAREVVTFMGIGGKWESGHRRNHRCATSSFRGSGYLEVPSVQSGSHPP
jgi:hypothetical protein